MSDDTLSQLVAEAIRDNLAPIVKWLYATFAGVAVGTAFVVGMVYDVKSGIENAKRDAQEAKHSVGDLRATVHGHDRSIAVLEAKAKEARP